MKTAIQTVINTTVFILRTINLRPLVAVDGPGQKVFNGL